MNDSWDDPADYEWLERFEQRVLPASQMTFEALLRRCERLSEYAEPPRPLRPARMTLKERPRRSGSFVLFGEARNVCEVRAQRESLGVGLWHKDDVIEEDYLLQTLENGAVTLGRQIKRAA